MIQRQVERPDWRQLSEHCRGKYGHCGETRMYSLFFSWHPDEPYCLFMIAFCEKTTPCQSGRLESEGCTLTKETSACNFQPWAPRPSRDVVQDLRTLGWVTGAFPTPVCLACLVSIHWSVFVQASSLFLALSLIHLFYRDDATVNFSICL